MKKTCIIQQECGIGDVFFCQNIAKKYVEEGYEVIWPLSPFVYNTIPEHLCVSGVSYFDNSKDFPFKDKFLELYHNKKIVKDENFILIPLGWSQHVEAVKYERTMTAKYAMCGLDYRQWKDDIKIVRNKEREEKLYSSLGLSKNELYYFTNTIYATPPNIITKNVSSCFNDLNLSSLKHVEMKLLPEFSVFDWCGVIENAQYIITVDTCIMYFMEFLKLKSLKNYCYPRSGRNTVAEIHDLFNTNWTYYI
jgi:hypothetical protein